MELDLQKEDKMTSNTLLNLLFYRPKEKDSHYLGFKNPRIKKYSLIQISKFLNSKNVLNNEKLSFITNLQALFIENPDIMSILCNINSANDLKDTLYYQFVNLYLNIIFSESNIDDYITQLKKAILDILNVLIHNNDCPYSIYEYFYSYISSYYLNEKPTFNSTIFNEYLKLFEVLYGAREWNQICCTFPKSYIYCQGGNKLILDQYKKCTTTSSNGIKFYIWFYIKKTDYI